MVSRIIEKLNGSTQGTTLLILIVTLLFTAGGWVYQLKQTAVDIRAIQEDYMRKDVIQSELKALNKSIDQLNEELCRLREYLIQKK